MKDEVVYKVGWDFPVSTSVLTEQILPTRPILKPILFRHMVRGESDHEDNIVKLGKNNSVNS